MIQRLLTLLRASHFRENQEILLALCKVILWRVAGRKYVWIRREGILMRVGLKRGQGLWCALAGRSYEPELSWLLEQIKTGEAFLDIGANVGIYSLWAARAVGPAGRVWSFEPNPACMAILAQSVLANGFEQIQLEPLAVGNQEGEACLEAGDPSGRWNSLRLGEGQTGCKSIKIQATCLDHHFGSTVFPRRIFLKIDAEGQEESIIDGGKEFFKKTRPFLILEMIKKHDYERLRNKLALLGYCESKPLKDITGNLSANRIFVPMNPG